MRETLKLKWDEKRSEMFLIQGENTEVSVKLHPCFPWRYPSSHLSVRNHEGEELGYIKDMDELSEDSQNAVKRSLAEALFHFEILDVLKVEEDFELRNWLVVTSQGERTFQTKLTDWPRRLPSGSYVIRDVHGDLFVIRNAESLSKSSLKKMKAFTDN